MKNHSFPIDIVYTWVDGSDPTHQNFLARLGKQHEYCRYSNNNEILYSLKSVLKFAPWVRNIYIVVADYQRLDTSMLPKELQQKITQIPHSAMMPHTALPTFQSQSIESCLHNISGLSEHFIYFNDDTFLGNSVFPKDFFDAQGRALVLKSKLGVFSDMRLDLWTLPRREKNFKNTRSVFFKHIKKSKFFHLIPYRIAIHQCQPCRKSVLQYLWNNSDIKKAMISISHSKNRCRRDIIPIHLMQEIGLYLEKFKSKIFTDQVFLDIKNSFSDKLYLSILSNRPKLFCLNNSLSFPDEKIETSIESFLKLYYQDE